MSKVVSVTEMEVAQECGRKWAYQYREKVSREAVDAANVRLGVGREFAQRLERAMQKHPSERVAEAVRGVEPGGALARVIMGVPDKFWRAEWPVTEDRLVGEYDRADQTEWRCTNGWANWEPEVRVTGRPDLWGVLRGADGAVQGCVVYEFKTTADSNSQLARKLERYESWGVQAMRYAVLLHDVYEWVRPWPIYRQHVVINHLGTCLEGALVPVTPGVLDRTRQEMCAIAALVGSNTLHHFTSWCMMCEYQELCLAWLAGGDGRGLDG